MQVNCSFLKHMKLSHKLAKLCTFLYVPNPLDKHVHNEVEKIYIKWVYIWSCDKCKFLLVFESIDLNWRFLSTPYLAFTSCGYTYCPLRKLKKKSYNHTKPSHTKKRRELPCFVFVKYWERGCSAFMDTIPLFNSETERLSKCTLMR